MYRGRDRIFPFLLLAHVACTAWSAEDSSETPDAIEEIMVLGTRLSVPPARPPVTIERQEIDATQAATIADLLRGVPGITVIEPSGPGGVSELYIRGADANFTSVFVNGVLMNDSTDARGGAFDFSSVSPVEIARIDIAKGPYSALYGSGALAGVINIDTRVPVTDTPGGLFLASLGSDGYWQLGTGAHGPAAGGHAGLNANFTDFGEPTVGSTRTNLSLNGSYHAQPTQGLDVDLNLRGSQRDRTGFPAASGGSRLAQVHSLESFSADERSLGASATWKSERGSLKALLTYFDRDESGDTPAIPPGVFPGTPASITRTDFDRLMLTVQSSFRLGEFLEWGAGLEYRDEHGVSLGHLDFNGNVLATGFVHERQTMALFTEGRISNGDHLTATAGLRYDDYSDSQSGVSPQVAVVYRDGPGGSEISLAWGAGRKAPSLYALGDPLVGNPELQPEDSSGWDVRALLPLPGDVLTLSLAAYRYRYTNLVDFDFESFRLVNRSTVRSRGFEVQLKGPGTGTLRWQISAATNRNEVDGEEGALLHRPEVMASASLYWTPDDAWELVLSSNYEGSRPSSSIPGGFAELQSYTRINLAVSRALGRALDLQLAVDNLFDRNYEAMAGFPAPGRQVRVGLRKQF